MLFSFSVNRDNHLHFTDHSFVAFSIYVHTRKKQQAKSFAFFCLSSGLYCFLLICQNEVTNQFFVLFLCFCWSLLNSLLSRYFCRWCTIDDDCLYIDVSRKGRILKLKMITMMMMNRSQNEEASLDISNYFFNYYDHMFRCICFLCFFCVRMPKSNRKKEKEENTSSHYSTCSDACLLFFTR